MKSFLCIHVSFVVLFYCNVYKYIHVDCCFLKNQVDKNEQFRLFLNVESKSDPNQYTTNFLIETCTYMPLICQIINNLKKFVSITG